MEAIFLFESRKSSCKSFMLGLLMSDDTKRDCNHNLFNIEFPNFSEAN